MERLVFFAPFQINRSETVHPVQARGSSSAIPDSTTGARLGNSATSDRVPPIASTVFRIGRTNDARDVLGLPVDDARHDQGEAAIE